MFIVILASGGNVAKASIVVSVMYIVFYAVGLCIWGLVQYALSRLKSKVPGMVLPILNGISSVFGLILFIIGIAESAVNTLIIGIVFFIGCILNVIIFTIIYKKCRANMTNTSELEKMTVQDLD